MRCSDLLQYNLSYFSEMSIYPVDDIIEIMISEFPENAKEIKSLFNESTSFAEICEDYVLCLDSICRLKAKKNSHSNREITDLKWALTELHTELMSRINQ